MDSIAFGQPGSSLEGLLFVSHNAGPRIGETLEPSELTMVDLATFQRIAVAAPVRRTGIASTLLARVEAEASARHADRIMLEVRDDNAGALAFYARQGFSELDRRPRYYADGTTAIILVRDVVHASAEWTP